MFKDFYDDFDEEKMEKLLEFMKLDKEIKVTSLSREISEKLNLSLVLSKKADIYILDEPIARVDPVAREKILDAIINNYNPDSSMIITTHFVKNIERIFDDVAFISEGETIKYGIAEDLRMGLSIFVWVSAFLFVLIFNINNFKRELYESRGYLTFTLSIQGR